MVAKVIWDKCHLGSHALKRTGSVTIKIPSIIPIDLILEIKHHYCTASQVCQENCILHLLTCKQVIQDSTVTIWIVKSNCPAEQGLGPEPIID